MNHDSNRHGAARCEPPTLRATWRIALVTVVAALAAGSVAVAQSRRGPGGMMRGDAGVQRELFPPELVMRFQTEIGLSSEQEKILIEEMQALQSDLVPLQFEMSEAAGNLREALAGSRVEEEAALALSDRLMSLETKIKQRHLTLMIRVKNTLTPEQQQHLRELREDQRERRDDGGSRRGRQGRGRTGPRP